MSAAEIRPLSWDEYSAFLETVAHSPFQRAAWLKLVERFNPIEVMLLGCYAAGSLEAVVPLMRRRVGPLKIYGAPLRRCPVPPATPFCAPRERAESVLSALDTWVRSQGFGYVQVTSPLRAMSPAVGDASETLDNLELDASKPLQELWQQLPKKNRYTVRRAIKDGVRLHWASGGGFMEAQARLVHDTYARQGVGARSNYPLELYEALLEHRREAGLRVLYATVEGQVVAAAWLLTGSRRCYYWDAVTGEEGRRINANQALVWCLIRWARRHGFDLIDFVGTARGGRGGGRPGIGHFKRSMGATAVEYQIVYWYSPVYRLALRVYRTWSRLRLGIASLRSRRDEHEH